jgi:hypothetical protein
MVKCGWCGKPDNSVNGFCSPKCQHESSTHSSEAVAVEPEPKDPKCAWCGNPDDSVNGYCSPKCEHESNAGEAPATPSAPSAPSAPPAAPEEMVVFMGSEMTKGSADFYKFAIPLVIIIMAWISFQRAGGGR